MKSVRDPEHEGGGDKTDSHVLIASIYRHPREGEVKENFFGQLSKASVPSSHNGVFNSVTFWKNISADHRPPNTMGRISPLRKVGGIR